MKRPKSKRQRRQQVYIVAGVILIILVVVAVVRSLPPSTIIIPTRTPDSLSNVPQLGANSQLSYHWHVHLDIFINGTSVLIPDDLGHPSNGLLYALHTHDVSGIIHIEPPAGNLNLYSLRQIFEVWGYPDFSSTQIFTYSGQFNTLYVNGTVRQFSANYPLTCHEEIAIVYGSGPASIPSTYDFGSAGCSN